MELAPLKRFAHLELDKLELQFPVFSWRDTEDPIEMNAIFSKKEWKTDSPLQKLNGERQDWIHWFASDPSTGAYVEIFFERLESQLAVAWVQLRVDGRRLVLKEALYKDSSEGSVYSAGGIRLECNAPMRLWRLAVNAIFDEPNKPENHAGVHIRLGARASMAGHTFELPKQVKASFLAKRFCYEENFEKAKSEILRCCSSCQAILQPNTIYAEIIVDGKKQELLLFGSRLKFFGNSDFLRNLQIHIGYAENGTTFTAIDTGGKAYGYGSNPTDYVTPLRQGRWGPIALKNDSLNVQESLSFNIGGWLHKFSMNSMDTYPISSLSASEADAWSTGKIAGTLSVRKRDFRMLSTVFRLRGSYAIPDEKIKLCQFLQFPAESSGQLLLSTSDVECKNSELTGGKGSSLAVLTEISHQLKSFTVPSAVVLTVHAYEEFAKDPKIASAIDEFLQESRGANLTDLRKASEKCVLAISSANLPEKIATQLEARLLSVFGTDWESKKFAVRSSAVGEDSEEMSAAGQMTTFLGTRGKQEILSAVVNCWASQFALTAVNYKRQYGQELNSLMAVIVQEMVSAESAGVMFTCDPVTSNPSCIFITANFGLGESVVSAAADPDTYSLHRSQNKVVLNAKTCGAKDRMIVESEFGKGTEEKIVAMDIAQTFCLTNERAVEIASIGAALSDITNSPRDIEWAVVGGKIYLLQSRPVTSFLRESDFEIRHDMNSALYTNREILSRGNIDEVMPGAFSPLGISYMCYLLFDTFIKVTASKMTAMKIERSQFTFLNTANVGKKSFMNLSKNAFSQNRSFMENMSVSTFGYDISEHEAMTNGIFHPPSASSQLKTMQFMYNALSLSLRKIVKSAQTQAEQIRFDGSKNADSLTLFIDTLRMIPTSRKFMESLMAASIPSNVYNVMTLNVLKSSQGETQHTPEIMILLSKLLRSQYEVESAQIPKELMNVSNLLVDDPSSEHFLKLDCEGALRWLESDDGVAAKEFRRLKSKNAHRCYKEFDIYSKTWDIDPIPLVQTLQSNVRSGKQTASAKREDFMSVDQLPKQPSFLQRKLLNYLIPKTQYAVYAREATKSAVVKSVHQIRLGMRRVGLQLHAEGRLPDPELVFFFTCDELYRFIKTRNPTLLPKAIRRLKLHNLLDKEQFPVLLHGMPKPIDSTSISIDPNAESMKGTPVSEGIVVGRARVIKDFLTEAHQIEKGDILITRATDTGWTPYFPLLGGVVTEIGGLLSHGAVVAREYGLPAVVGVQGVTEFVKSGDVVTLDGNMGVLHKATPTSEGAETGINAARVDHNLNLVSVAA